MSITSLVSTPSLLTIPPFYEPGAPPPTLPILIAQTEVGNIERPDKLLTQEELGTSPPCKNTPHPKAAPRCQPSKHSRSLTPPSLLTIPPFYEPGAPPPILPILIAQTEVGNIVRPDKLLAQEELGTGPASKSTLNSTHRFTPYPMKHSRSLTPKHHDVTSGTESDRASESDSDSATSEDNLIPKPDGEAGRPGRGGYNLEKALRWEHKKYCQVKNAVKKLVSQELDPSKSFTSQRVGAIRVIESLACVKFPELEDYSNCWPVMDLIRLELKYTSSKARAQSKSDAKVARHRHRKAQID